MDRRERARQRRNLYRVGAMYAPLVDIPPTHAAALEARETIRRLDPELGRRLDSAIPLEHSMIRELHSLRWLLSRRELQDNLVEDGVSVLNPQ